MDNNSNSNFPHLPLDFLRRYTCGTYQIKQSKAYAKVHLYENDKEFALELSPSDDNLLRCRLQSRHSNNTQYLLCAGLMKMTTTTRSKNTTVNVKVAQGWSTVVDTLQPYLGILVIPATSVGHHRRALINFGKALQNVDKYSLSIR